MSNKKMEQTEHHSRERRAPELLSLKEAAPLLGIAWGTLRNWVADGKFTKKDGLVRIGGYPKVNVTILRQRIKQGQAAVHGKRRVRPN